MHNNSSGVICRKYFRNFYIDKRFFIPRKMKQIKIVTLGVIFFLVFLIYILSVNIFKDDDNDVKVNLDVPEFNSSSIYQTDWFYLNCLDIPSLSISTFYRAIQYWATVNNRKCRDLYKNFTSIYSVTQREGRPIFPLTFEPKVKKWLGYDKTLFRQAKLQKIIHVYNLYTKEETSFNPLRTKKPISKPAIPPEVYIEQVFNETKPNCDFCNYEKFTAQDSFGRVDNEYAFSASNTFKLDRYHSLFIMKEHHPLKWKYHHFMDMTKTLSQWFRKIHDEAPEFIYPSFIMDLLPHGGASQVHPHMQGFLTPDRYYGTVENWRSAAKEHNTKFPGQNYFSSMISIHDALGLTIRYGSAVALVHIVPKKEYEVVIFSEKGDRDFFELYYLVVRAFLDDLGQLCYSSGGVLPIMDRSVSGRIPAYIRIVSRGAVSNILAEVSSLELFSSSNVNVDPFKVHKDLKKSIKKQIKNLNTLL